MNQEFVNNIINELLKPENISKNLGTFVTSTVVFIVTVILFQKALPFIYNKIMLKPIKISFSNKVLDETDYEIQDGWLYFLNKTKYFIKHNKSFYESDRYRPDERVEFKYPTVTFLSNNKTEKTVFQKYCRITVSNYKLNPEQVIFIKPEIPSFKLDETVNCSNNDLSILIEHNGYDVIYGFEVSIVEPNIISNFTNSTTHIAIIKPKEIQQISILNTDQFLNLTNSLSLNSINIQIKYTVMNQIISSNYLLQFDIGRASTFEFNKENGFYFMKRLFGSRGGGCDSEKIANINVDSKDFENENEKVYELDFDRKLSGVKDYEAMEQLQFQIILDKPAYFEFEMVLLDLNKKIISNSLKRKYKTLFTNY